MEFDELLAQVLYLLQRDKRVSYRALQHRFALDAEALEAVKDELIEAKQQARDENGKVLVWADSPEPKSVAVGAPPLEEAPADAERRHLTVMFSDIVDSTALSSRLDPEDYREVIRAYQTTCAEAIARYDGHIAQYLGDSLLVYFGYPHAHEDDPQRAIYAGLAILEAVTGLNARLLEQYGESIGLRIGIHTGVVIVGEVGDGDRQELLAMGRAPNVAARLQAVAATDSIAVSATTYRLIQGYFVCQDLGMHTLKGLAEPLQVYRVLQESAAHSRFEVASASGLTPLVGREAETGLLLRSWEQSKAEQGSVILLGGEGGIGKSRLVAWLREQIARDGGMTVMFHCSPYYANSAFHAVVECLQRHMQWQRQEDPQGKVSKLEQLLREAGLPLPETLPLFATLLSVPLPAERYSDLALSPQRHKQQTQATLVAWLLGKVKTQPLLVVWEDLQWADPSTLELLGLLLDQVPTARMLVLLTCRPEFRLQWGARSHLTQIMLRRLERQQIAQMVHHLTRGKALPPEVVEQVRIKTDGVPLFIEELVKMVLESGLVREETARYVMTGPLPSFAIPTTLQDSLMARLDRLQTAREVVQLGATLGRTFAYELIHAVSRLEEELLQQELGRLVEAELLYQQGLPPQATYRFKHALIQEAAYQSLVRSTRQRYHERIAHVLTTQFPGTVETQPELLAYHYTEAGLGTQAVPYWQQAGQRASARSAQVEAIHHLSKGLEVIETLPETPARVQQELALLLTLGPSLLMIRGHGAPEVEATYSRAYVLCQQVGEGPQRFSAMAGLWRFYFNRARFETVRELAEQCFVLAQDMQDPVLLQEAHLMLGSTLLFLGEFLAARDHLERSMALYDPQHSRARALTSGTNPGVVCFARTAWVLWLLGYPGQALHRMQQALALAEELSHPYSLGFALNYAAVLHGWRQEIPLVQERVTALIALASEQGFVAWMNGGLVMQAWALIKQGAITEGITQLHQALEAIQPLGYELVQTQRCARLAEAYGACAQAEEGLRILAEGLALVHRNGDHYYEAELCRLKGVSLLLQAVPNPQEAEACFLQALDMARQQHAKAWELRAATSLSQLWQQQGRHAEACQLLAESYGWFTEGFDTADLQAAKAVLDSLQ
jgi:class 3 adenylate cyclase/predicted ATPase